VYRNPARATISLVSTEQNRYRSDARGIAEMLRLGQYRPQHVKSKASQPLRTTLTAREKLAEHMVAIERTIRGLLKVHGLKLGNVHRCTFAARVETLLADAPELCIAIEPLLEVRNVMRKQKVLLDRQLGAIARKDKIMQAVDDYSGCWSWHSGRRLMREGQSVSIPVRRSRSARAVSLDDPTPPDPIMERAIEPTPDRSAGRADADQLRKFSAATIVTRRAETLRGSGRKRALADRA
jgi:hypothetical protein